MRFIYTQIIYSFEWFRKIRIALAPSKAGVQKLIDRNRSLAGWILAFVVRNDENGLLITFYGSIIHKRYQNRIDKKTLDFLVASTGQAW